MLWIFLIACLLVNCTVWIHAAGIALLMRYWTRPHTPVLGTFAILKVLLRIIWWLLLFHFAEITLWALFYLWRGCFPDAESAFYFSGVTYTTLGYGDVVLAKPWRLLAPLEGLVGVLMCSLSMGYFFVVVNRVVQHEQQRLAALSGIEER
jgi:hypothetical protein